MSIDCWQLIAIRPFARHAITIVAVLILSAGQSAAQHVRMAQQAAPQAQQQQTPAPLVMPSARQIVLLTRTTLLTLNDALRTGNYSVLHDVGAPDFRKANPPQRLAQIFSTLVARRADLALVALTVPRMDEALVDEKARLLRLRGSFPTLPKQVNFVLLFQEVGGIWRLFGISVDTSDARPAPANVAAGGRPANTAPGAGRANPPPAPNRTAADPAPTPAAAPANQPPLPTRNPGVRGWSTGVAPANASAAAAPVSAPAPAASSPPAERQRPRRSNSSSRENEDWGQ